MQGSPCPGIFIVHSGLVRVVRGGTRGQQHVLHLCGPGQSFAEVAVFGNFDLPASAIAAQATECLVIPADVIQREISSNHELCRQLLSGMAMWTRHFVQMLDDLVLRDATERVARVLCDAPSDQSGAAILPGPKKDLANHLNLTSETFSRVLRRFIDDGVLETDAARAIRILQPDRLKQLSEREFRRQG